MDRGFKIHSFLPHPKNDTNLYKIQLTLKSILQHKIDAKITPIFTYLDFFLQFYKLFLYNQLTASMAEDQE